MLLVAVRHYLHTVCAYMRLSVSSLKHAVMMSLWEKEANRKVVQFNSRE
jgi:hypothetical protein